MHAAWNTQRQWHPIVLGIFWDGLEGSEIWEQGGRNRRVFNLRGQAVWCDLKVPATWEFICWQKATSNGWNSHRCSKRHHCWEIRASKVRQQFCLFPNRFISFLMFHCKLFLSALGSTINWATDCDVVLLLCSFFNMCTLASVYIY